MRLLIALSLSFSLSGCAELAAVERGACGNKVLEPGEDCDVFSRLEGGTCAQPEETNACFYRCDDSTVCPGGWSCGNDGRCRQPSGKFSRASGSPWPFEVDDFALGDVNGDRLADLVGNDRDEITVRFGSEDASFEEAAQLRTRPPLGPLTFARLDQDELLDVVVPTDIGLFVLRGNAERTMDPVAFAPFDFGETQVDLVAIDALEGDLESELLIFDGENHEINSAEASAAAAAFPAGAELTDLVRPVPVGNLVTATPRDEFVVAFRGQNAVQVYRAKDVDHGPPAGPEDFVPELIRTVTIPGTVKDALLADYDGDGKLDLLIASSDVSGNISVAVSLNQAGGLEVAATIDPASPLNQKPGFRFPLAAMPLIGGNLALIYRDGIFIADLTNPGGPPGPEPLTPTVIAISEPFWADAAIGDFNHDGRDDVAMITAGESRVDIFLGSGFGVFNAFRVDAGRALRTNRVMRVGDFDGNFFDDIAFVALAEGDGPDELEVIFGAADAAFAPPESMGKIGKTVSIEPMLGVSSAGVVDLISDLIVLSDLPGDGGPRRAASIFEGSSSRRLLSPFSLVADDGEFHVPLRAVVGDFIDDGDGIRDLLAVAARPVDLDDENAVSVPSVWLIPGLGGEGQLDSGNDTFRTLPDITDGFEVLCASWAVGDIDASASNKDELVGIDSSRQCGFAGIDSGGASLMVVSSVPGGPSPLDVSHQALLDSTGTALDGTSLVQLSDLDIDGDLDVLSIFGSPGGANTRSATVSLLWNDGGTLTPNPDPVEEIPPDLDILAVRSARLNADRFPDLVVLASTGVYTMLYQADDPAQRRFGKPVLISPETRGRLLGTGDVDGNGLDDIAFVFAGKVEVLLAEPEPPLGDTP